MSQSSKTKSGALHMSDLAKALDEIDWYRRLLEAAFEGRPVRNLDEAQLGYQRAMEFLRGKL